MGITVDKLSGTLREFYESRNGGDVDVPNTSFYGDEEIFEGMFGVIQVIRDECGEFSLFHVMEDRFAILNLKVNNHDDLIKIGKLDSEGVPSSEIVNDFIDSFNVLSWVEGAIDEVDGGWDNTVSEFHSKAFDEVWDSLPRG